MSFPCQPFGQLYTRPDRIHNKCDLQTDSRHFTEGRVEGHAGRDLLSEPESSEQAGSRLRSR